METALSLKDISYTYQTLQGETKSLEHLSFSVEPGEFAVIVGPSGCGKTTLLNIIAGLLTDYTGQIDVPKPIGYMFQKDQLLEWRSIYKNVVLGLEIKQQMNQENICKINRMLKRYGLEEFKHSYPRQLSGGMRRELRLSGRWRFRRNCCCWMSRFPRWMRRRGYRFPMTLVPSLKKNR